jgi:hypothetical protein
MCRHRLPAETNGACPLILPEMTICELLPKLEEEASVRFEVRKAIFAGLLEYTQI